MYWKLFLEPSLPQNSVLVLSWVINIILLPEAFFQFQSTISTMCCTSRSKLQTRKLFSCEIHSFCAKIFLSLQAWNHNFSLGPNLLLLKEIGTQGLSPYTLPSLYVFMHYGTKLSCEWRAFKDLEVLRLHKFSKLQNRAIWRNKTHFVPRFYYFIYLVHYHCIDTSTTDHS